MANNATHLSVIPEGATLLAWHNQVDAQAVRLADKREVLLVEGQEVAHFHPVQCVVNLGYCRSKNELADHMNVLRGLR